jgi:hypothetical protein
MFHQPKEKKMKNVKKTIAGVVSTLLVGAGLAIVPVMAAEAHTPSITSTCNTISADLSNYEYVAGTPAVVETKIVTPKVDGTPAVWSVGTPEIPERSHKLFEYAHADQGNGNSDKTRWELEGWNAGENGKGWVPTGNEQTIVEQTFVAAVPSVLITPEVLAVPEVTTTTEVKPAVKEQDNTITLILDGVTTDVIHFGTSYKGTKNIDGTKNHTYSVIIDAIGIGYDKTINGKTTACVVPPTEIPYPTLIGTDICGPDNDTVTTDPAWLEKYSSIVAGPWIDMKYKTNADGKRVVDGSAQIKAEFRKTYIWAGTSTTSASDFRRWQMYPGTAPFIHVDVATECPVVTPPTEEPPVVIPPVEEPPVVIPPVEEPPVVVPPVVEVPVEVPAAIIPVEATPQLVVEKVTPVVQTDDVLAHTGFEVLPVLELGGALALMGLLLFKLRKRRPEAVIENETYK